MKNKIIIYCFLFLTLLLLFTQSAFTQNYHWEWAVAINSPENAEAKYMEIDMEGNSYLLTRLTGDYRKQNRTPPTGSEDVSWVLTKYNATGLELWQKDLNNYTSMILRGLKIDHEGNCFLIGQFSEQYVYFMGERMDNSDGLEGGGDSFLAKILTNGKLAYTINTGRRGGDRLSSLAVDGMGNAYVMRKGSDAAELRKAAEENNGKLKFAKRSKRTLTAIKFAPNGSILWHTDIAEYQTNSVQIESAEVDFEGNYYLAGRHTGDNLGDLNYFEDLKMRKVLYEQTPNFVMKISTEGPILWVDQFPGTKIQVDEIGNIFLLARTPNDFWEIKEATIERQESENLALIKYDSEGAFETYSTFGSLNSQLNKLARYDEYEYGLDGNLYLLTSLRNESLLGAERTREEGIFLLRFNTDCELTGYVAKINDDTQSDLQNPFQFGANKSSLDFLRINMDGEAFLGGSMKDRNLLLGGTRLNNPYNATGARAVFWGKLRF